MNAQALIDACAKCLEPIDAVARCNAMLCAKYSFRQVGGPFVDMNPATVLREIDPIQWQITLNRICERDELVKLGDHYYDKMDAENIADDVAEGYNSRIHDLRTRQRVHPEDHDMLAIKIANLEAERDYIKDYIK